jgi:hypothetical protein
VNLVRVYVQGHAIRQIRPTVVSKRTGDAKSRRYRQELGEPEILQWHAKYYDARRRSRDDLLHFAIEAPTDIPLRKNSYIDWVAQTE